MAYMRYGNLNIKGLKLQHNKKTVKGLPLIDCVDQVCEGCVLGKHHRERLISSKKILERNKTIGSSTCRYMGCHENLVTKKNKYYDFSRRTWVYFISLIVVQKEVWKI